jgi:YesN/AraC family two-component response regulator
MEDRVLFVDDEQNVLSSIKRMLFDESYEQYFASGGEEALALLADTPVSVIISDMRMPIMDGVQFLEKSRKIVPDAIRIILSGQAELVSVMQAINRGGLWRFISKPWNDNDLKCTIKNALDLYRVQEERKALLVELEIKNRELLTLNEELERRVAQRTMLIEAQKQLLQQMVDGMDLFAFANASCSILTRLTGSNQVALLHGIGSQSIVSSGNAPTLSQKEQLVKVMNSSAEADESLYLTFPVIHASNAIGAVGVQYHDTKLQQQTREILTSMTPVISLALGQFKMIADAPGLINDLDDMIDKL